jgi:hypothetical protein
MATTAGSTTRGFAYPGDSSAADVPAHLKAMAEDIDAYFDGDVEVGGTVQTPGLLRPDGAGYAVEVGNGTNKNFGTLDLYNVVGSGPGTLKVGGSTVVLLPSPYFRAYRSSAASYASGATVVFDSETDPNGWYDNATGIFLPTIAGMYRLSWGLRAGVFLTADNFFGSAVILGGSVTVWGSVDYQRGSATGKLVSVGSALLPFNGSTDSAVVVLNHNNSGSLAVDASTASCHFEAEYVGA